LVRLAIETPISIPMPTADRGLPHAASPEQLIDVVILLHGIRTRALWYDIAKRLLSEIDNVEVKTIGYGRFDVIRFLLPFTRKSVRKLVLKEIKLIKWKLAKELRPAQISVIAHSFGTYTIIKILEEEDDIDLHTLVLCGSVLPSNYDFGHISRKVSHAIINDAGSRDIFPVLARLATVGYGDSGTFGFLKGLVQDRFHTFRHSDFFTKDFISRYWVSIFSERKVYSSEMDRSLQKSPVLVRLLSGFPEGILPKYVLPLLLAIFLVPPSVKAAKTWLAPVLNPEVIIQADHETLCHTALGNLEPEEMTSMLVTLPVTPSFKAEVLCEVAQKGNPTEVRVLSWYARSLVLSRNAERAVSIFSEAADKGDKFSLQVLASYYSHYIEQNGVKSIECYKKWVFAESSGRI
jgi:pimeloyl-ACP methyl ester carboxylesterase